MSMPFSRVARDARLLALVVIVISTARAESAETLVHNVAEFDAAVKTAQPGDTIVMADGEWRDADLVFKGNTAPSNWIMLRAETPGNVVLTGTSRLRIGGRGLGVSGLLWRDTTAKDDVISFRIDSKTHAFECVVQNCAIIGDAADKERKWVSLYGRENKLSHCRFEGKRSGGTLLVVWLDDGPCSHIISLNYFGTRERLGKNGGEIIRVGDSKTSMVESKALVMHNYFYRCSGEAEIISNKSCGNRYANNVFVGCGGALTLRHGNACEVAGNCFIGDGQSGTGGVRVIGEEQNVHGNVFYKLTGDDARAAVSIMNGISDSPLNGYFQVKNARITGNMFVECKESIVVGLSDEDQKKQTLPPVDCTITGNTVVSASRPVFFVRTEPQGMTHEDNLYSGDELGIEATKGWQKFAGPIDFDVQTYELPTTPAEVGPEWMRPGDEYLPKVLKKK